MEGLRNLLTLDFQPSHSMRERRAMIALAAAVAALFVVGVVLTWRRFFGDAGEALSLWLLAPTVVVTAVLIEGSRRVWRHLWPSADGPKLARQEQWLGWGGSAALVLMGVGCSYPGDTATEWLAWLPLVIADQFRRQVFFDRGAAMPPAASSAEAIATPAEAANVSILDEGPANDLDQAPINSCVDGDPHGDVLQQLFRVRDEHGVETVYGSVTAEFIPGQRHAVVHVGFCPPLERLPEIEAEPCAGPDARIKVLGAYAHGVRLEVRLSEPARQPCRVVVDLAATPSAEPSVA